MTAARFKGAPFNLRTIRQHRTRKGLEWQYWNSKVGRWCRYTTQPAGLEDARQRIAQWCYGCAPEDVAVEVC